MVRISEIVDDHCDAIRFILENGEIGEIYNVGSGNDLANITNTNLILKETNKPDSLKMFVQDRLGHDRRYSLDGKKLKVLGWIPRRNFHEAMQTTINWYKENEDWWKPLKSSEYINYYNENYKGLE